MTHASLTVRKVALKAALPHPKNPRVHPPKGTAEYEALRKSLLNEYFDPLVWNNRTGHLVSGHYRRTILIDEGYRSADMVVVDWDEPTHLARMLAANELNGQFDDPKLLDLLRTIGDDLSQDLTGLTDERIKALLAMAPDEPKQLDAEPQIDRAAELAKKWGVKTGQLWRLGEHRLMCGDNRKSADINALMEGELVGLVVTDPPYNIASENGVIASDVSKAMAELKDADWDKNFDPLPALEAIPMAHDVTAYVFTSHHLAQQIWDWMKSWADHYSWCVWSKPNPMPSLSKRHWTWNAELIPYATRGNHIFNFPEQGHAPCVWEFTKSSDGTHPTQKPVELIAHAIHHSSDEGHLVFDGFSGSGTTILACERLSRRCRAMEISPAYVAVGLQRWADATGQTPELL